MGRSILVSLLAGSIGLLGAHAGASAQQVPAANVIPNLADEQPRAASPSGATYIPGVGFRFLAPGGPRVYGWAYGYRTPVYGYRYRAHRRACRDRDGWDSDRCGHRWR